jgi:hypothetical protein
MVNYIINSESFYDNITKPLNRMSCQTPWLHIEIHSRGQVSACCHSWLPIWVGNFLQDTPEEILNNSERLRIQEDMRKGSFSNCNDQCPQLNSFLTGGNSYWDIVPTELLETRINQQPIQIGFSYDPSCNLQCPSCRTKLIVLNPEDESDRDGQRIKKIHLGVKNLVKILLDKGKRVNLNITGSGDAFASPLYWNYLIELSKEDINPNLSISLKTNGVMMTLENLEKIRSLWPIITYMEVSIDAATEKTYKIVRKNGNFKKLQKNLIDFDNLVYNKNFKKLYNWQTNIIIQKDNYKELKEFVEWQLTFKSKPKIWTNLLAQWYHISDDQFNEMAVWKENHPDRINLIEILKDPIFLNPQIKLGNMSSLIPK